MYRYLCALSLIGLLGGSNALADGKGYAGAQCYANSSASISNGRYLNGGTAAITITCPIINDVIGSDFVDSAGYVWFLDLSASDAVACTQYSRYQSTSSVSGYSAAGSYPSGSGSSATYTSSSPTKMSFSGSLGTLSIASQATWNYITCYVPAVYDSSKSGIIAYYVEEND